MGDPTQKDEIPLQPQVTLDPFEKWGMDFVGSIGSLFRHKRHIIVCTYYLTKWAKVKVVKATKKQKVAKFLRDNIF